MTDQTPDPPAVLGRLEEIERRHFTGTIGTRCNCGYQIFPCDAIQLARALRAQQERERALVDALSFYADPDNYAERIFGSNPVEQDTGDEARRVLIGTPDPIEWRKRAAAAPSREGE